MKADKPREFAEDRRICSQAKVAVEKLDGARSNRAKSTILGNLLATWLGRKVPIQVGDRAGTAELCMREGRSKKKTYFFSVSWDEPMAQEAQDGAKAGGEPSGTAARNRTKPLSRPAPPASPTRKRQASKAKEEEPGSSRAGGRKEAQRDPGPGNDEVW